MISYAPLRVYLSKQNIRITDLIDKLGFSSATTTKISKNQFISLSSIVKISNEFNLPVEKIIFLGSDLDYLRSITSDDDIFTEPFIKGELHDFYY